MKFWDVEEAVVICDGANYGDCLIGVSRMVGIGAGNIDNTRDGHRWAVDFGHEEAAENYFVEVRVGATCSERDVRRSSSFCGRRSGLVESWFQKARLTYGLESGIVLPGA